ncbi:MAG: NUDIX domain-containing protein [Nanoarchaeales archaeon]|nr:NUDIX domain-containing protein [Nanoarchaeales archaeon]
MANTIKAACAIIYKPNTTNEILICQRSKYSKLHPLEWEILGGKYEPNETGEQCIIREIKEELNIDIIEPKLYHKQTHAYDYADVHLEFFKVKKYKGEMKNIVHEQIKWEKIENIKKYKFLEGDDEVIDMLIKSL